MADLPAVPPYQLIRSNRRTLALEVTREGGVLVRAPRRLPRAQIDAFVAAHEAWIRRALARRAAHAAAHPEPTAQEVEALRRRALDELPARVAHWSGVMGLVPAGVRITAARTRFGSCSAKGRLCFSLYLMRYPAAAVDCVVVHELAHLRCRGHGPDFYALVESVLPDYHARAALLRE